MGPILAGGRQSRVGPRTDCGLRGLSLSAEFSELRGPPPQSYHEDKRDGFEEYGPSSSTTGF